MKILSNKDVLLVSGGREAQGAFNANGPDRTRRQAMRENHPGRGPMTDAELRNLGLALGLIGGVGAVISKSVAMQIISAAGSAASAFGGWESKGSSPGSHGDHD